MIAGAKRWCLTKGDFTKAKDGNSAPKKKSARGKQTWAASAIMAPAKQCLSEDAGPALLGIIAALAGRNLSASGENRAT